MCPPFSFARAVVLSLSTCLKLPPSPTEPGYPAPHSLVQVRCVVVYDEARVEADADRGEVEGDDPFDEVQTGQARIPDEQVRSAGMGTVGQLRC